MLHVGDGGGKQESIILLLSSLSSEVRHSKLQHHTHDYQRKYWVRVCISCSAAVFHQVSTAAVVGTTKYMRIRCNQVVLGALTPHTTHSPQPGFDFLFLHDVYVCVMRAVKNTRYLVLI